ncbi:MAG: glycosyltransferase family 2 protein [Candidatus Peribacteraceae bacterium]
MSAPYLSIILPVHNEAGNISTLLAEIAAMLPSLPATEVIAVDDGSTDTSAKELQQMSEKYPFVRTLLLARNFGQTAAIAAGMDHAKGAVLLPMDADLQNDPQDIPLFLQKIDEGYDIVSGWRRNRHDAWLRSLLSRVANKLIRNVSGQEIHDYGCTMKAYKREVIEDVGLFGDMHRFLAAYAGMRGARVAEVVTHHRPRTAGVSKYGFGRIWKVMLDLFMLSFFLRSLTRPMQFFGSIGLVSILSGFVIIIAAFVWRQLGGPTFIETPLPVLVALLEIVGVQCVLMGVLGELTMRTYFNSSRSKSYRVRAVFPHTDHNDSK